MTTSPPSCGTWGVPFERETTRKNVRTTLRNQGVRRRRRSERNLKLLRRANRPARGVKPHRRGGAPFFNVSLLFLRRKMSAHEPLYCRQPIVAIRSRRYPPRKKQMPGSRRACPTPHLKEPSRELGMRALCPSIWLEDDHKRRPSSPPLPHSSTPLSLGRVFDALCMCMGGSRSRSRPGSPRYLLGRPHLLAERKQWWCSK